MHHLHDFNYWAIVVAALFQWFLGALWYSPPLFAKPWAAMLGIKMDGEKKGLATGMIASILCDLLLCFVLAHIVLWSGAASFGHGALAGFIVWCGFFVAKSAAGNLRAPAVQAVCYQQWLLAAGAACERRHPRDLAVGGPDAASKMAVWRKQRRVQRQRSRQAAHRRRSGRTRRASRRADLSSRRGRWRSTRCTRRCWRRASASRRS